MKRNAVQRAVDGRAIIAKGFVRLSQTMTESGPRHTQTWRQEATSRVFGSLIAICLLLAALGWVWPAATDALRYQRDAVLQGQVWRLLTAHLVHGDGQHLALNMVGTVLIAALFPQTYRAGQWVVILLMSAGAIGIGFLAWNPGLHWYVGASGILHGALAAGVIAWWRAGQHGLATALAVVLAGKLAWEQWQGALPLTSGLAVIVDAHAYGVGGGILGSMAVLGWQRRGEQPERASL